MVSLCLGVWVLLRSVLGLSLLLLLLSSSVMVNWSLATFLLTSSSFPSSYRCDAKLNFLPQVLLEHLLAPFLLDEYA